MSRRCNAMSRSWRKCLGRVVLGVGLLVAGATAVAQVADAVRDPVPKWWDADTDDRIPAHVLYDNPYGKLGVLNASGEVLTGDHPFLTPIGRNGRACITCHQPGNAMSVSVDSLRERWKTVGASDPVFAPVDGANCPNLPRGDQASHSLLLDHGLFRVPRPWPPRDLSGAVIQPEFTIEVVRDPTGCNTSRAYGLRSPHPTISVFRRPRVAANMRYVMSESADTNPIGNKTGLPRARDPQSGKWIYLPILADGGQPSIERQSAAAASGHLEMIEAMSPQQFQRITDFLMQIYVAQEYSNGAGKLTGPGNPPALGTEALRAGEGLVFAVREDRAVFHSFAMWKNAAPATPQEDFRASVERGYDIYFRRPFFISDVPGFTTIGIGNPYKRTCAFCHNGQLSGIDVSPGFMDIGVQNLPTADPAPHLPLFKLTCSRSAPPHPYLGRVVFTHDPGRALISGKCADIGSINLQQIRGLAARAPYFANGSAKDLRAVVDYYDRRFTMKLSERDKVDLVNFMSVL